jgi:acid phosphatase (class A)
LGKLIAMRNSRRWLAAGSALMLAIGAWWWLDDRATRFLPADTTAFVARFAPPAAPDAADTRRELDELLALQQARTPGEVAAARADRKTEVSRFYGALGLDAQAPPKLPRTQKLAQRVEDDVRIYVRAAKDHFRRLRPYEIEPRLEPCIADVKGDLSYPSGHAAFAWAMAGLLSDLVPERREALAARAAEFSRQRLVCGVHFPSDLAAGRLAAGWVLQSIRKEREYASEAAAAAAEVREALGLPMARPASPPLPSQPASTN